MRGIAGAVLLASVSAACSQTALRATLPPLGPGPEVTLGAPGRNHAMPALASLGRFVAVAWTASGAGHPTEVLVAVSADAGGSFSKPVRANVDDESDSASGREPRIGWEFTSMTIDDVGRMPVIRVDWAPSRGGPLRTARSTDGGRSFTTSSPSRGQGMEWPGQPAAEVLVPGVLSAAVVSHVRSVNDPAGAPLAAWDEVGPGQTRRVVFRRVLPSRGSGAAFSEAATVMSGAGSAAFPVVGAISGGAIVAWVAGDAPNTTIAVRRVGLDDWCGVPGKDGTVVHPAGVVPRG